MWNKYRALAALCIICTLLCGCASWVAKPTQVVLLPEERIFTVPAGQPIDLYLDGKKMAMTFPYDMKVVSSELLVKQEQKLNNALLDKIQASGKSKTILTILGIIASALGIFFAVKIKGIWPKVTIENK